MAQQPDILGMFTGISSKPISPSEQAGNDLRSAVSGMFGKETREVKQQRQVADLIANFDTMSPRAQKQTVAQLQVAVQTELASQLAPRVGAKASEEMVRNFSTKTLEEKKKKINTQERKKKELQLKIDRIKNYDWDQYILEVSDIGYRDIAKTVIDNRFTKRNSFKQIEINKTKNFSSENWQFICEALSLLFKTNVEYKEKRKESIVDEFHDVIHEGEMYYNLNIYSNMAHGLTIRNAVFLYENMHESIRNLAIENMEKRRQEHREAINSMYKKKQENKSNELP